MVIVRVGNTTGPVPAMTGELLVSQVACMQAGGCLTPVAISYEKFAAGVDTKLG